jgi:hypothetical protein
MKFKNWLKLTETITINHVDPEEDWEEGEKADIIAKKVGIRIDRTKDLALIAVDEKGDVVGALYSNVQRDHDASEESGEEVGILSFDVVVDPDLAKSFDLVGPKLIKQGESLIQDYPQYDKIYIRNWVVNPKLAKAMQSPKFGYDVESEHGDGSAHLIKYL